MNRSTFAVVLSVLGRGYWKSSLDTSPRRSMPRFLSTDPFLRTSLIVAESLSISLLCTSLPYGKHVCNSTLLYSECLGRCTDSLLLTLATSTSATALLSLSSLITVESLRCHYIPSCKYLWQHHVRTRDTPYVSRTPLPRIIPA